jgi:hypothetical protein
MDLFLSLCVIAAVIIWAKTRIDTLEEATAERDRRIAQLTERIFAIEQRGVAPKPQPQPAPAPVMHAAPPPQVAPPPPLPALPIPPAPPEPKRDMEALIGGNWLSKLGVLILLIGLALFVAFALAGFGPTGRIAIGALTSLSLLGAGIAFERKPDYRTLGVALIGGGWAGLYFTAFAAHGIEAARIIDSPGAGFFLLLAVAAGMILHSLKYRSQTVTGLAYAAAFLTIAISSLTQFSGVAAIPLLISLLTISWKFGWQRLAALGASFSYLAYGFDLATGDKDRYFIAIGEPLLWTYWVILELFDLAVLRKYRDGQLTSYLPVAPFNLTGFLLATSAVWPRSGWTPGAMLLTMAIAQLLSAVLRGRRNANGDIEDTSVFGGYRASLTFSACFAAAQILDRFSGLQQALALALLAQIIALTGWMLRAAYIRGLGAVLFLLPLGTIGRGWWPKSYALLSVLGIVNRAVFGGGAWYTAGAAITAGAVLLDFHPPHFRPVFLTIAAGVVGLVLRWREKPEAKWAGLFLALLSLAALLINTPNELLAVTIALPVVLYAAFGFAIVEGPPRFATFALMQFFAAALLYRLIGESPWLIAGLAALALASSIRGPQSLKASALLPEAMAAAYWFGTALGKEDNFAAKAIAAACIFAMYLLAHETEDTAANIAATCHALLALLLTAIVIGEFVNGRRLTLAWTAQAATVLALGFALRRRLLRLSGLAIFAFCLAKLFFYDFSQLDVLSRIASFIVLGVLMITASWAYSRFRNQIQRYL